MPKEGQLMTLEQHALILFAHGARDPSWADPMRDVQALIQSQSPQTRVCLSFLEFLTPTLETCVDSLLAEGISRITLLPMFMASGGHLIKDLPNQVAALRLKYPSLRIDVTPPAGVAPPVQQAIANYAICCLQPSNMAIP